MARYICLWRCIQSHALAQDAFKETWSFGGTYLSSSDAIIKFYVQNCIRDWGSRKAWLAACILTLQYGCLLIICHECLRGPGGMILTYRQNSHCLRNSIYVKYSTEQQGAVIMNSWKMDHRYSGGQVVPASSSKASTFSIHCLSTFQGDWIWTLGFRV